MQIQSICSSMNRPVFRGNFETTNELEKLMESANEKDLLEFSLMLDVIKNSSDKKLFYIKEKKPTMLNPEKGFILWCQEHWDSFPKPYKGVTLDNVDDKKVLTPLLGKFTSLLKSLYNVKFEKDVKTHLKKQILTKLVK